MINGRMGERVINVRVRESVISEKMRESHKWNNERNSDKWENALSFSSLVLRLFRASTFELFDIEIKKLE